MTNISNNDDNFKTYILDFPQCYPLSKSFLFCMPLEGGGSVKDNCVPYVCESVNGALDTVDSVKGLC